MDAKEKAFSNWSSKISEKVIKNLKSRKFDAYFCATSAQAVEKAISLIPEGHSVSWGGSNTINEIGLIKRVYEAGYNVIDRDNAENIEQRMDLMRQSLLCDTFLTSFNALSEDGVLVNIDGNGNRVAAIAFGPKSVIAVIGMNKLCKTVEDARSRARNYTAPLLSHRPVQSQFLQAPEGTPCYLTGSCGDCKSDQCLCSYIVETRMSRVKGRIKIILVGEPLGF